jgi:hypothetical protein
MSYNADCHYVTGVLTPQKSKENASKNRQVNLQESRGNCEGNFSQLLPIKKAPGTEAKFTVKISNPKDYLCIPQKHGLPPIIFRIINGELERVIPIAWGNI